MYGKYLAILPRKEKWELSEGDYRTTWKYIKR